VKSHQAHQFGHYGNTGEDYSHAVEEEIDSMRILKLSEHLPSSNRHERQK
jgi:hypothetical protein